MKLLQYPEHPIFHPTGYSDNASSSDETCKPLTYHVFF